MRKLTDYLKDLGIGIGLATVALTFNHLGVYGQITKEIPKTEEIKDNQKRKSLDDYTLTEEKVSPKGDIIIEHYRIKEDPGSGGEQVWLSDAKNRKNRLKIGERPNYVHVNKAELSPNEKYLAIEPCGTNGTCSVNFFKREKGLDYRELKGVGEKIRDLHKKELGLSREPYTHTYIEIIGWSPDSSKLLVSYTGSLNAGPTESDKGKNKWYCVVDLDKEECSNDLNSMNKDVPNIRKRVVEEFNKMWESTLGKIEDENSLK